MAKGFGNAAGYSPTSASERSAVNLVAHFLDQRFCKSHFATDDKVPNTDGFITLTDAVQTPIGRLDVQIKKIKSTTKPAYQCKKPFLGFCSHSQLPVLLIGVDTETKKVYWKHFSREVLAELSLQLKGKSIKVQFDESDQIGQGKDDYVERWVKIIQAEKSVVADAVFIKERYVELQNQFNAIAPYSGSSLGKSSEEFKSIHHFLDVYNRLMDTDFNILKRVVYDNAWKLGLAYANLTEQYIEYSLFPISWDQNDVQIKPLPKGPEVWEQYSWISMDHENPMKDPTAFSYRIIQRDIKDVFKHKAILLFTEELAAEYIFDVIDVHYRDLGYSEDVKECLVYEMLNKMQEFRATQTLDLMFSEEYLMNSLIFLHSSKIEKIKRPLAKRRSVFSMNANEWKTYNSQKLIVLLSDYYNLLPRIYDQFIKSYFPLLAIELGYFTRFDKQIILIKKHFRADDLYVISVLNIRRIDGAASDNLPIFIDRDNDDSLFQGIKTWDIISHQPVIDGTRYQITLGSEGGHGFLFKHLTLFNEIYAIAGEKLDDYLSKRVGPGLATI